MNNLRSKIVLAIWGTTALLSAPAGHAQGIPGQLSALQVKVDALQTQVAVLQAQLAAVKSNKALLLDPFLDVDPNPEVAVIGPNIVFHGANVHIVSGSGGTDDNGNPTGLGNLIIGYNEDPGLAPPPFNQFAFPLGPGGRSGSHNLVIGRWNQFPKSAFGGIVAGELNIIEGEATSVTGGLSNQAVGKYSNVNGGFGNGTLGEGSSVLGGTSNTAVGRYSAVVGGQGNISRGDESSILGGNGNNTATGSFFSVVLGGQSNTASINFSIVP
jgi:hypothetical protein